MIEALARAGADCAAADAEGRTPLMRAVDLNSPVLVAALLACGGTAVGDAATVQRAETRNLELTQAAAATAAEAAKAAAAAENEAEQVDNVELQSSNEIIRALLKHKVEGVEHVHEAYAAGLLIPEWEEQQAAAAAAAEAAAAEAVAAAEEDENKAAEVEATDDNVVTVEVEIA